MQTVAIIGLGYVGLPLAVAIGKKYPTIGFDINSKRITELEDGKDHTREVSDEELRASDQLHFTNNAQELAHANWYIVTVPTPIDQHKKPDLTPLIGASRVVGKYLKKGAVVIYESTVYPGCTEEVCVPILEKESGLIFNNDFFCGYSPERINPGDKERRLESILKVTSGSTAEKAEEIDSFYASFITVGTYKAPSIKVAEAAKVIENAQRDINIAFVNELSHIFDKLQIDTREVLKAAGTKWNFLNFQPGLVGGHCIGVDPYYLAHKAESVGYHPQVILTGRKVNDGMGAFVAQQVTKSLSKKGLISTKSRVLILGITFKEDCPDIRNTRVIDIYAELKEYGLTVDVFDPNADPIEVKVEYDIDLISQLPHWDEYSAVIAAVKHKEFLNWNWNNITERIPVIYDVKGVVPGELPVNRL